MKILTVMTLSALILIPWMIHPQPAAGGDFWAGFGIAFGGLFLLNHMTHHWFYDYYPAYPGYPIYRYEPSYTYETRVITDRPVCSRRWIEGHWGIESKVRGKGFTTFYKRWVPGSWEAVCP